MIKFIGVFNYSIESLSLISFFFAITLIIGCIACFFLFAVVASDELDRVNPKFAPLFIILFGLLFILGSWPHIFIGSFVIGIGLIIQIIILSGSLISEYNSFNDVLGNSNVAILDFKTIKTLYDLNPDRFCGFSETYLVYRTYNTRTGHEDIRICIPDFREYLKYRHLQKEIEKQKEQEKKNGSETKTIKATQRVLEQAQIDIMTLRKKSADEIKEAADIFHSIDF